MKVDRILSVLVVVVLAMAAVIGGIKRSKLEKPAVEPRTPVGKLSLLVVGIEGLDLSTIERLSHEGRLPNISKLMADGATGVFANSGRLAPPEIAWTSLASGVAPGKLGMGRPLERVKNGVTTTSPAPLTPEFRTAETLWTILSAKGSGVAVLSWPGTWPVEEVKGVMVGPYTTYVLERAHGGDLSKGLYPASERASLDPLIQDHGASSRADLAQFVNLDSRLGLEALIGRTYETLDTALAADRSMLNLARRIAGRSDARNMLVFLGGLDIVTERFWHYAHPNDIRWEGVAAHSRGLLEGQVEALGAVIDRYYETEDATLGELLKMAADDGTVAVIASHGYVGLRYGATGNLKMGAEMYSEQGLFIIRGPRIAKNVRANDGTLLDVAPTIMAAAAIPAPATIDGKVHEEVLVAR